ncbi:MAG: phage holin family protein [Oscillospiraceae bacterium]|jgi:hypothetical protein
MDFGFTNIAAITVICYLVAQLIKATKLNKKWLPIISGTLGGLLGVLSVHLMPEFPAKDYITATAIGIASGLAATGAHQIGKQLSNKKNGDG